MSQGDPKAWLPTTSILMLLAGASYLAFDRPLESRRPARSSEIDAARSVDGRVDARLWQDPFEAAESAAAEFIKACEANEGRAADLPADPGRNRRHACIEESNQLLLDLREQVASNDNSENATTLVIGAFLPSDPFSESYETRMRERFAVSTALNRAHYRPADTLGLHYVLNFPEADLLKGKLPRATDVVPYDVFLADTDYDAQARAGSDDRRRTKFVPGRPDRVIVLWLRGVRLSSDDRQSAARAKIAATPLQNIFFELHSSLMANGRKRCDWNIQQNRDCVSFAILGPTSSDELESWSHDAAFGVIGGDRQDLGAPELRPEFFKPLRLYINRATARLPIVPGKHEALRDESRGGIRYVVPADYRVMPHLTSELRRRLAPQSCGPMSGFAPWRWGAEPDTKRILVISEGDTRYARNLVSLFRSNIRLSFDKQLLGGCVKVRAYYTDYLQGLDGEIGQSASKSAGSSGSVTGLLGRAASGPTRSALEYPAGRAQLDRVKDMIARQQRRDGSTVLKPLDAIVILGSDVYDKLLLIQAARVVAPRALLLTTDLDSRFFDPAEYDATRNLIVVSALGFSDHKDQDMRQAPEPVHFRDAYQTSTYLAIRQAICEFHRADADCVRPVGDPRIFEVGRTRPVALDVKSIEESNVVQTQATADIFAVLFIAALVLTSAFVGGRYLLWLASEHHLQAHLLWTLVGLAGYVGVYWLWFWPKATVPGVEPFYLLEGVSIWPTQILRQITTVLACGFMIFMVYDVRRSNTRLEKRNPLLCPAGSVPAFESLAEQLRHCARWFWFARRPTGLRKFWESASVNYWVHTLAARSNDSTQHIDVTPAEVWTRYRQLGHAPVRLLRIGTSFASLVALYLLIWIVASDDVNSVPARAGLLKISAFDYWRSAFFANAIAISLCAAVALLCVSFVIDATRLCTAFVRWWTMACTHGKTLLSPADITSAIQVVGERTGAVAKFVVYPFCIMSVLVVSRSGYFDDWGFPISFAVIMFMVGVHALAAAWSLRRLCERMRSELIKHIRLRLIAPGPDDKVAPGAWDNTLTFIADYRAGAFSEWFRNPLLRALLLPAGGAGIVTALLDAAAMH
jgi:hypothetical protein